MAVKGRRAGSKNPPIFSHEFVIQNHADIVSWTFFSVFLDVAVAIFELLSLFASTSSYGIFGVLGPDRIMYRLHPSSESGIQTFQIWALERVVCNSIVSTHTYAN